jgi:hypothetical protein
VPSELSSKEPAHEENLLIEAVSLLVQRQRETESWVAEQVWQTEERATATERRYADLETRLAGIEEQLGQLLREVGSGRSEVVDEGLARLREQVQDLKSAADGHPTRSVTTQVLPRAEEAPPPREPELRPAQAVAVPDPDAPRPARNAAEVRDSEPRRPIGPPARSTRAAVATSSSSQQVGFLELLGSTTEDRWGFALIVSGAVAVLYALLTQLPFR